MADSFQYVDGVGNVTVSNGMAHIELVVVRPPQAEGEKQRVQPVSNLVMALPQFVRLCSEMARHLQGMEEKGMIKRRAADDTDTPASA